MKVIHGGILLLCLLTVYGTAHGGDQQQPPAFCKYLEGEESSTVSNSVDFAERSNGLAEFQDGGIVLPTTDIIKCGVGIQYCFTLWHVDPMNESLVLGVLKQGCWGSAGNEDQCLNDECVSLSRANFHALGNNVVTKFCCCRGTTGKMCNEKFRDGYVPPLSVHSESSIASTAMPGDKYSYRERTIIIALSSVVSMAVFVAVAYWAFRVWKMVRKQPPDDMNLMEAPVTVASVPQLDLSQLRLCELLDRGRYGHVWKGILYDREVAVKVFSPHHKQFFQNEQEVYGLPHMDHDNLLHFIGADERVSETGCLEYIIVLSYVPTGTLHSHLKNELLNWSSFIRIVQSITAGLSHLHMEVIKGGLYKPPVAHRDFNSRNILVLPDGSCVICDLGFAVQTSSSKIIRNGSLENAETVSLADVGTVRYMAPEILEGAVNLCDCEASLKQIDIYALGLVLWETAMRCADFFQGLEVPEYQLPFQAEVGIHPNFENMQIVVCRNKWRPQFPDIWKDTNQVIRSLKETIEDCWDQDAEARLTALCVQERMLDLPILWERQRAKGINSTVPPTHLRNLSSPQDSMDIADKNSNVEQQPMLDSGGHVDTEEAHETHALLPCNGRVPYRHYQNEASMSERTEETVVLSPSEDEPSIPIQVPMRGNSNLYVIPQQLVKLEPHQGRNPCMERNLHVDDGAPFSVSGNTLVDAEQSATVSSVIEPVQTNVINSEMVSARPNQTPIPYVQNPVREGVMRAKQDNVPGNGAHRDLSAQNGVVPTSAPTAPSKSDKKEGKKSKGFFSFFEKKWLSPQRRENAEEQTPAFVNHNAYDNNSNVTTSPVNTEVRLVNGSAQTVALNNVLDEGLTCPPVGQHNNGIVARAELGTARRNILAAEQQAEMVSRQRPTPAVAQNDPQSSVTWESFPPSAGQVNASSDSLHSNDDQLLDLSVPVTAEGQDNLQPKRPEQNNVALLGLKNVAKANVAVQNGVLPAVGVNGGNGFITSTSPSSPKTVSNGDVARGSPETLNSISAL